MAPQAGNDGTGKSFKQVGWGRQEPRVNDDDEIDWHRELIAKNRALLAELEAGNTAGGDVFPETQSEIERLKAQLAQSELIVAGYEKENPEAS
jgi:hypothetical protein